MKQKAQQKSAVEISKWCTKPLKSTKDTKMISELAVKGMSFQMVTK